MEIIIKMLEDVYEPTPAGWIKYSAGKRYKIPKNTAESISKAGCGVYMIKPEDFNK